MEYGLIGEKLGHSFSREVHARLAPYQYELRELAPDEVGPFLLARDFRAINVTIPYKKDVIPYLDHVDPMALSIGAVNTVVNRGGELWGYNTDYYGMQYLITSLGFDPRGKKVLIAGTGGTSLTAVALLTEMGAREVLRLSRTPKGDSISYEEAYQHHADAACLVNCTPVGMYPRCDGMPVDLERLPSLEAVVDAVYRPIRTQLVLAARARGIAATGGTGMLVAQAVRAAEHFLDATFPSARIDAIVDELEREKEHIILIGMPACGKSTVGRLIAEQTGRAFFDIDAEIVRRCGCDIPTIFSQKGERAFREIEAEVLREVLFSTTGAVIATGGGAPLREDNRAAMTGTGRIYLIDRSPALLVPTGDRPTASTREAIAARYRERYDVYRAACDVRVDGDGDVLDVANQILKEHLL